jgi:hypothetical protein
MNRALALFVLASVAAAGCTSSNPSQPSAAAPAAVAGNATASIAAPRPLTPANNAQVRNADQPVTLTALNAITTATSAVTYTFEVASDAAFASRVQTWDNVAEGSSGQTSQRLDPLAAARDYWWHVRATGGGTTGVFGPAYKFTVGPAITINAPVPIAPLTGGTTPPRPALRVINAVRSGPVGPITYRFEISTASTFPSLVTGGTNAEGANETGFVPAADLPLDSLLYWRAFAIDAANGVTSAPSAVQSFTPHRPSQAELVAAQLGVPLWPGQQPTGTVGHATMGGFWNVEYVTSPIDGYRFLNPPLDELQIFDLLDRGFAPQAAIDWMNSHGYPTAAAFYPSVLVIGFQYEYLALNGGRWDIVLKVGA